MNIKIIQIALIHLTVAACMYSILYYFNIIKLIPSNETLQNWDADWFHSIKSSGYLLINGERSNVAFFPLFSYLWRFSYLNATGISILNIGILILSLAILFHKTHHSLQFHLLILSISPFIFFSVPYSESLFFLFITLIISGHRKNNITMIFIGYFGASAVRSVGLLFIPAVVFIFFLDRNSEKNWKMSLASLSGIILGLGMVVLIQYYNTHQWFAFLKVQSYWGRDWHAPRLPLTTTFPNRTLSIDSMAYAVGLIAIFYCFFWFYQRVIYDRINNLDASNQSNPVFLSALCIAGITILDTCYTFLINDSSNIWSINRHILCTPFAIVLIVYWLKTFVRRFETFILAGIIVCVVLLTGLYRYPDQLLNYLLFFVPFILLKYFWQYNSLVYIAYFYNTFLQVIFFEDFLNGLWIG